MNLEFIRKTPLFAELTEDEQSLIADRFRQVQCAKGTSIFDRGDEADSVYMIASGFARLLNERGVSIATLGPGSLLGESEFLRAEPHAMSAVAAGDVALWQLSDKDLQGLIQNYPEIGLTLSRSFGEQVVQMEGYLVERLAATELLGDLPYHLLSAMAARLKPRTLRESDVLFQPGQEPQGLFLLEEGMLELEPDGDGPLRQIYPGEVFGSLSLLTHKPYRSTAWADRPSLIWTLTADDFHRLSAQSPSLRRTLGRRVRSRLGPAEQTQAVIRLAQTPIFTDMEPENLHAVAQRLVLQHVPAGEPVYRSGDAGDALYLVDQGEIELTTENASGVVEELGRVDTGNFFGEMSLLTGKNRTEDATATRNTNLWILYKADLDELVSQYPDVGTALNQVVAARLDAQKESIDEERYRRFPLLANLSSRELKDVVKQLRPTRYQPGEQIFRAGTPGDAIYLIEGGHVRLQPLAGGKSWMVSAGDLFGEKAVLTNQLRGQAAYAETEVNLLTIGREELEQLMMRMPSLAMGLSRILSQRLSEAPVPEQEQQQNTPVQLPASNPVTLSSQRRHAAADRQAAGLRQNGLGIQDWFSDLSTGAKLRLALLAVLLAYLFFVAAPAAFNRLLAGPTVAASGPSIVSSNALGSIGSLMASEESQLASAGSGALQLVAMAEEQLQPTETYTPFPTNTPLPTSTPTETPIPTDTPTPLPTATPTPVPPEPVVEQRSAPIEEEVEEAELQPEPALPPRAWDGRLDALGIHLQEAGVSSGQPYWRLIEAQWENEQEAGGKHHIYVEVLDENGERIVGQPVTVFWSGGGDTLQTEEKPAPEFALNYPMFKAGNSYNVKVEGLPSDTVNGIGLGTPDLPFHTIHTNTKLTFQKTTVP